MPLQRKPKLNQTTKPEANSRLFFLFCMLWVLGICTASAQVSSNVTLAWNPSADPNLAGYRVYQGAASHKGKNNDDQKERQKVGKTGGLGGIVGQHGPQHEKNPMGHVDLVHDAINQG